MNNVVQFPTEFARTHNGNKVGVYQTKLTNLAKMLDARYEHLHELAEIMNRVTDECEKLEKDYEVILQAYSERVGPENVEIEFYDYSAEVDFEFIPDENTFKINNVDRTDDHREHVEANMPDGDNVA